MESITSVGMTQSEHYYTQDNYGLAADVIPNSQWSGKGAAQLGLSGPIRTEDFKHLLHAVALDGQALHRRQRTSGRARAGVDLTFNPPKSVSQRALVGGDTRLVQAHQTAVATTLSILERCCAQTRIARSGQRCKINTGNLTIGQFLDDLSRAKDPHLHSHCLVFNFTQKTDGQWQSLDNSLLYQDKMLGGLIYRNELAVAVQQLGYAIERYEGGLWEIAGYQPEALAHFSKRSQQIKAKAGEHATSRQKEWAARATRPAKEKNVCREELYADWQAQAAALGVVHPDPVHTYVSPEAHAVAAAVAAAITHCEQRESPFTQKELQLQMLADVGRYRFAAVETALNDAPALELLDSCHHYVRPSQAPQAETDAANPLSTAPQSTASFALEQFHQFLAAAAAQRQARNPRKPRRFASRGAQGAAEPHDPNLESAPDRAAPIAAQPETEHLLRDAATDNRAELQRVGSKTAHHRRTAQRVEVASTEDEPASTAETPALGWADQPADAPAGLAETADGSTASNRPEAQHHRAQTQAHRSPTELASNSMEMEIDAEPQLHKPQPDSEQWQRAAFLLDYAVAAINRTGQDQVENDAYWAVWHEDNQHLMIGRQADQAVIVEAHFNHKTEQWGIDYSKVDLADWQDFKDRQQARQQQEREYYHGLYNQFAPQQFASAEQRDRVVAGQVWQWAQTQGLEERAAAKEAALTLVYQAHVQQMGQQQGDDVALAYVNRIVREATAQQQLSVERAKQIEL